MADLPAGLTPVNTDIPVAPRSTAPSLPAGLTPVPDYLQNAPTTQATAESPATPAPTFVEDVKQRYAGRRAEVSMSIEDMLTGQLPPDRALTQIIGKGVAGTVIDVSGAGISAGAREFVGLLPEGVKKEVKGYAQSAMNWLENSVVAQEALLYAKAGADKYAGWKERNPQDAKTLEAIVDIGALLGPAKQAKPSTFSRWADTLEASAAKGRTEFVTALVLPARSRKVRLEEVPRTYQKGPLFRNVASPSKLEADAIVEVSKLPVTAARSPQYNYNIVRDYNYKLANTLEESLQRSGIQIPQATVANALDNAVITMQATASTLTGDAGAVAAKVTEYAKTLFAASDGTAAGLLRTRRQFDDWVRRQRGDAALNGDKLSAINIAVRTVRNTLNDVLDQAAPNAAVKESLRKQHLLFTAMENIQEKAADEAATLIGRTMQNIHKATGASLPSTPLALGATAAAAGSMAAAAWFPYLALPLAATAGAALVLKGTTSPLTRQWAAGVFRQIDKAIKTTNNQQMKATLAKDRLALLELLRQLPEEKEEKETTE